MLSKYICIFAIFLIFLYLNFADCHIEKMNPLQLTNTIVPMDNYKLPNVPVPKINLLKPGQTFEILDLPYCNEKFKVEYGTNTNYVLNDGKKIFQDMLKPYEQKAFIGSEEQGLTQISWKKSFFTFNGKPVGLELHFAHTNPKTGKRIRVIFPLSLDSNKSQKINETFVDVYSENNNFNNLSRLNILLQNSSDVPVLVQGQVNTGKLLSVNLCEPAKLILEQKKFFFAETPNEEILLISKPQSFDKNIGLTIMKNLQESDYELVKPIS